MKVLANNPHASHLAFIRCFTNTHSPHKFPHTHTHTLAVCFVFIRVWFLLGSFVLVVMSTVSATAAF